MDGLDFQISEKPLSELIAECHRRLIGNESVLLIIPRFNDDIEKLFNGILETPDGQDMPKVSSADVLIEKFPKKLQPPIPDWSRWGWSDKDFIMVFPVPILVFALQKPDIWKKFDRSEHFKARNDVIPFWQHNEPEDNRSRWFVSKIQEHEDRLQNKEIAPIELQLGELENGNQIELLLNTCNLRIDSVNCGRVAMMLLQSVNTTLVDGAQIGNYIPHNKKFARYADMSKFKKMMSTKLAGSEAAFVWYDFAVRLDPRNFYAWYTMGYILGKSSDNNKSLDYDKMENYFRQCIRHNPKYTVAYKALSRLLIVQGLYRIALETIDTAIKQEPDMHVHDYHSVRGDVLFELGEYDDAVAEYDIAIALLLASSSIPDKTKDGGNLYNSIRKVMALDELGKIPEIINVYEDLLVRSPNDLATLNNLGYWHNENGESKEALVYWMKCLEIYPEMWPPNLSVGLFFLKNGNTEKGKTFINKAAELCPAEYKEDIKEMQIETLETIIEKEAKKTFSEKAKDLGSFSLTRDRDKNDELAINMLRNCKEFIFWVEPYFSIGGLKWIREACASPAQVKKIEILTKFKEFGTNVEIYQEGFKRKFDALKTELEEKGISISLQVCMDPEYEKRIHGRFIFTSDGKAWGVPSIMNFKVGSDDEVTPSGKEKSDFDEVLKFSLDFVKDNDEIMSKYDAWKAKQEE